MIWNTKIKHYVAGWPHKLKIPLLEREKKFFHFLEISTKFEDYIAAIRKKYKIPQRGFSYLKENEIGIGIPKYLNFDKWDQYLQPVPDSNPERLLRNPQGRPVICCCSRYRVGESNPCC